jgi:hypothetical protein
LAYFTILNNSLLRSGSPQLLRLTLSIPEVLSRTFLKISKLKMPGFLLIWLMKHILQERLQIELVSKMIALRGLTSIFTI